MRSFVAAFFLLAFWSGSSWALELTFGVDAYYFDYREQLPGSLKSNEAATVFALDASARIPAAPWGSFVKLTGELSPSTKSSYDGSTQKGTPVSADNLQSFSKAEADYYIQIHELVYLYGGLGYRSWNRFLNGGTGYREIYSWGYAPFGALLEIPVTDHFKWGLDVSYRMMFAGEIRVIFSETVVNGDDTTLNLGNRGGYRIQVPFHWSLSDPLYAIVFAPWYEYSEIGASDFKYNSTLVLDDPMSTPHPLGPIQEPNSRTHQYGAELGLSFNF